MKSLPGRCTNEMFCTLGAAGRIIHIADDQPFICPVCGRRLTTPAAPRRHRQRGAALFGFTVTLLVAASFFVGLSAAGLPILHWATDMIGWPMLPRAGSTWQALPAAGRQSPDVPAQ
jgi:hypothetical protein